MPDEVKEFVGEGDTTYRCGGTSLIITTYGTTIIHVQAQEITSVRSYDHHEGIDIGFIAAKDTFDELTAIFGHIIEGTP